MSGRSCACPCRPSVPVRSYPFRQHNSANCASATARQGSLRHEVGSGRCGNDQGPHVAPNPQKATRETPIRDGLTLRLPLIYIPHSARELTTNIATLRSSLRVLNAPRITIEPVPDYAHSRFAFSLSTVGLRQLYTFNPTTNFTVHCHTFTMPVNLL